MGGRPKREGYMHTYSICMIIAYDSLCCTAEANTTLKSNYTSVKKKKEEEERKLIRHYIREVWDLPLVVRLLDKDPAIS